MIRVFNKKEILLKFVWMVWCFLIGFDGVIVEGLW